MCSTASWSGKETKRLAASFCERGRGPGKDSARARRSSRLNQFRLGAVRRVNNGPGGINEQPTGGADQQNKRVNVKQGIKLVAAGIAQRTKPLRGPAEEHRGYKRARHAHRVQEPEQGSQVLAAHVGNRSPPGSQL